MFVSSWVDDKAKMWGGEWISGSALEHARLCSFQNQHVSTTRTPHLGLSSENDISFIYVEAGHHFRFDCIGTTSSSSVVLLSCCVRFDLSILISNTLHLRSNTHRYTSLLQHVLSVVFEEQENRLKEHDLTRYIRHLQRICELVVQKPVRDAFRHHVVYLLSHYLKLAVRRKDPLALNHEKSMMSVVASMFDVCSKHELQQLHILLDPPRRALMKTLHKKYLAEYKYSGNVWGLKLLYFLQLLQIAFLNDTNTP